MFETGPRRRPRWRRTRGRARSAFRLTAEADGAERAWGTVVSGSYFTTVGVAERLGRTLLLEDDRVVGGHPVVVISDRLWRRRFGALPHVWGRWSA